MLMKARQLEFSRCHSLSIQCDEEIREYERVPLQLNISSNTQHIERLVQLNAQVGKKAGSSILRDGIVKATIESRQECPKLENKSNFHK